MRASSTDALMDILLQGQKYMTWLPFDHTEKRALLYLEHFHSWRNRWDSL
jgi:hypothetical protein